MEDFGRIQLKPITRVPLPEVVAKSIIGLIQEGHLRIGDKLPSQKELEEMLKVSRPCLREALSGLVMLGYIEARAGQGYYVKMQNGMQTVDFSNISDLVDDERIKFIMETRTIIEPKIAEVAASRRTEEDLKRMYKVVEDTEKSLPATQALEIGVSFHQVVADASHNPYLIEIEKKILSSFVDFLPFLFSDTPSYERDVVTHMKIVKQIEAGNAQGAAEAALNHICSFASEAEIKGMMS